MSGHSLAYDQLKSEASGGHADTVTAEIASSITNVSQISSTARFVTVTSGNSDYVVVLPPPVAGHQIWLTVGSNGFELRTPASSGNTINTVDADGTNELAVGANNVILCLATSSTGWFVDMFTTAGADVDGGTPN